jgi:hypothetical protein
MSVLEEKAVEVTAEAPRRLVLLGASNIARCLATAVETARSVAGGPLEILAAFGHGRSYGMRMPVLFRELPGIIECRLWDELGQRSPVPTAALVTDIGNDLLYDVPPQQIAEWVLACITRLREAGARVAMTPLPLCNLTHLSPRRFLFARTVLFPRCRLTYEKVVARAHDLDRRLRALAEEGSLTLVEHRAEWYGLDPIHIRPRWSAQAWNELFSPWRSNGQAATISPSIRRWLYLLTLAPEQRWLFGREFRKEQPAGRLPDGTSLAFY